MGAERVTRGGWDGRAAQYDQPPHVRHAGLLEWTARTALAGSVGPAVFDLGCGTGALTRALSATHRAQPGGSVHGLDGSTEMLAIADKMGGGVDYSRADCSRLDDFNPQPFADVLAARLLLRHLPNPTCVVRDWVDHLRLGGRLVIAEGPPPVDDPSHPAFTLYCDAMRLKHGAPKGTLTAGGIVGAMLAAGLEPVAAHQRWTHGNSIRTWCEAGNCDAETTERVLRLHREASAAAKIAYQMVVTDDDVICRWRHIVVTGERGPRLSR